MSDPAQILRDFKPSEAFFVGIDSDGCIFDSMEIKHKECFAPMFIKHFELQAVSKYAREVWEFVNLYSKTRGANRFPALSTAIKLLGARHQVQARGVKMPDLTALDEWIKRETKLGNATLMSTKNPCKNNFGFGGTLAPALSHRMGEGESSSVGRCIQPLWKLRETGLAVPSPVGRERVRVRGILFEIRLQSGTSFCTNP